MHTIGKKAWAGIVGDDVICEGPDGVVAEVPHLQGRALIREGTGGEFIDVSSRQAPCDSSTTAPTSEVKILNFFSSIKFQE